MIDRNSVPIRLSLTLVVLTVGGCAVGPSSVALKDFEHLCSIDPGGRHINRIADDVDGLIVETRLESIDLDGDHPQQSRGVGNFGLFERNESPKFDDPFLNGKSYKFVEFAKNDDEARNFMSSHYNLIPENRLYRVFLDQKTDGKCHAFSFSIEQFLKNTGNECAIAIKIDHLEARYKVTFSRTTYTRRLNQEDTLEKLERIITDVRTGEIIAQSSFLRLAWVDLLPDQVITNAMFYQHNVRGKERYCPAFKPLEIRSVLRPRG